MKQVSSIKRNEFSKRRALLATSFMLVSCLAYSLTPMMEALYTFGTSADLQRTARRYIPEYRTLHKHSCEDLTSYANLVLFETWNIAVISPSAIFTQQQMPKWQAIRQYQESTSKSSSIHRQGERGSCSTSRIMWRKSGHESRRNRTQDWLYWRGPAAIYLTDKNINTQWTLTKTKKQKVNRISTANILLTDLINALPGNSSVNTVQHASIDEATFSMSSAQRRGGTGLCNPLLGTCSVNTSTRIGQCYESGDVINNRDDVFRGVRAEELSWR
jgi:hypothetical protein